MPFSDTTDCTCLKDKDVFVEVKETVDDRRPACNRSPSVLGFLRRPLSAACEAYRLSVKLYHVISNRWWLWELGAWILSSLSMLGVIITLCKADETAIADWTFPFQPNSVISAFMAICKSAILVPISECISQSKWFQFQHAPQKLSTLQDIDDASQGPLGSAQLLTKPRAAGMIALMGAFLTVLSLALDPFTQQVLTFDSRNVQLPGNAAEVSITHSLAKIFKPDVEGAILSSLYTTEKSPLTYKCTTSSCQWPDPLTSIGVCSSCRDLKALVRPLCSTVPGPLFPTASDAWNFTATTCNYTITPTVSFSVHIQTLHLPAANGRPAEYANQYTQRQIFSPSINQNLSRLLETEARWITTTVSWATNYNDETYPMPALTIDDLDPEILLCGFYFCAQTYPSLSVDGNALVNATPISVPLNLTNPPMVVLPGQQGKAEVLAPVPRAGHEETNVTAPFLVSQQALFDIQGILREVFALGQSGGNDEFSVFPEANSGTDGLVFEDRAITETCSTVANTVTGQLMIAEGSNKITGTAMVSQAYMRVQWGWIALPLGVLAGAGLLLGGTVHKARRSKARIWKGSSLAVLLHPLKGCEEHAASVGTLEEIHDFASNVCVKLERDESGIGYAFVNSSKH
ncbi:hypothetical protein QBC47DRAFT_440044 [Echria macrotheca]|uniref:Uncharacterized protein n=1 Tax=Echria macrotheca TaxID=438768 RepID=A0AAJ0B102_9PEZI|nr:hypothetical protein QBC47DRAFT_440044 [Echria macrotheca]